LERECGGQRNESGETRELHLQFDSCRDVCGG
jgi:hypothetical protein